MMFVICLSVLACLLCSTGAVPVVDAATGRLTINLDSGLAESFVSVGVRQALADELDLDLLAVSVDSDSASRRLQTSSSLTITYVIDCGANCAAVSAQLSTFATDPAAGVAHAQSIIAAINSAAASSGFGSGVVLSSAADVAATLVEPDTVSSVLRCTLQD